MNLNLFDLYILVAADRRGGRGRIGGVFPIEHDIVGREGLAIVPLHARFQLPSHGHAIGSDPAILDIRDLRGKDRDQVSIWIPSRQRLVKNPRPFRVLGADGEMRVEQGRCMPKQCPQRSAAACSSRFVLDRGRGLRQASMSQELTRKLGGEAETDYSARKGATRDSAWFHRGDELSQLLIIHRNSSAGLLLMALPPRVKRHFALATSRCGRDR
jgi:hypothetical protein